MVNRWKGLFNCTVFIALTMLFLLAAKPTMCLANGIENLNNYSAEFGRTLNRTASTDAADAAAYNPAGTVKLEDGLYFSGSCQYIDKTFTSTLNGDVFESDNPILVPGVFSVYKKDQWAAFLSYTIASGGGKVEYENGSPTTSMIADLFLPDATDQYAKMTSFYQSIVLGASYAFSDKISGAVGIRYVQALWDVEAMISSDLESKSLSYEETDEGFGAVFGLNFSATEDLNIGIRYDTQVNLDLETKVEKDDLNLGALDLLVDGGKRKRDLPAIFGLGISYRLSENFRVEGGLIYYLNNKASWDDFGLTLRGDESDKNDGFDVGFVLEYLYSPKLKMSVGYLFTETGIEPDNMCLENPELDANTIGGGIGYAITPNVNVDLGVTRVFYKSETTSFGVGLDKKITLVVLGVQVKI